MSPPTPWYANEIRIVRNDKEIHSWESAQSFRRIPDFDGVQYREKKGTYKLKVARIDAQIYHYGWVRPPQYMQKKRKAFATIHSGHDKAEEYFRRQGEEFDFGNLSQLSVYHDTHPAVMQERIRLFNWSDQLERRRQSQSVIRHKHERLKYRLLTFIEQNFLGGRQIMSFKNYHLVSR